MLITIPTITRGVYDVTYVTHGADDMTYGANCAHSLRDTSLSRRLFFMAYLFKGEHILPLLPLMSSQTNKVQPGVEMFLQTKP